MNLKIFKRIFIILTFTLLFIAFNMMTVDAGYQRLNDLDFVIDVKEDGDMIITERWDVYIDDTNTLFKTFKIDDTYDNITDVSVSEIRNGKPYPFAQSNNWAYHVTRDYFHALVYDGEFEIAWGVDLEDSSATRTYEISYTVKNHVTLYNDAAQIYWQLIGAKFDVPINKIKGIINLPDGIEAEEDLLVWAHGPLNGSIMIDDLNHVSFTVEDLRREFLEIRLLMPTNIFIGNLKTNNTDIIDKAVTEETTWAEEANLARERYARNQKIFEAISFVAAILVSVFGISKFLKYKKVLNETEKKVAEQKMEYFREIPNENAGPAEASFLYYFSKGKIASHVSGVISATMLNLCLKKWIEFEVDANDKKKVIIRLKDTGKDLNKSEILVYDYLKKIATKYVKSEETKKVDEENRTLTIKDFRNYSIANEGSLEILLKNIPKEAEKENVSYGNFDLEQKRQCEEWDTSIGLNIFVGFFSFIFVSISPLMLVAMCIFIANIVLVNKIKGRINGLTQKGINEIEKWNGLYKYMKDFSLLKEREIPELVLWEKFLVYATAFGIADKVIKQLKVKFPELQNEEYMRSNFTYMHIACNTNFSSGLIYSINSSIGSAVNYSSGSGRRRWIF